MLFSTYRWVTVSFYVIGMAFLTLFVWAFAPSFVIGFVVIFALLGLLAFWVNFFLIRARLDDYGGRIPFPGGLGLLGVDIVDDDADHADDTDSDDSSDDDGPETEGEQPTRICAHCGATVTRPEAKFCDACGKSLEGSPLP
jgi:hypothetical protein